MKVVIMGNRKQQAPEAGYLHSEGVCHHHAQDSVSHDCVKLALELCLDRAAVVTCRDGGLNCALDQSGRRPFPDIHIPSGGGGAFGTMASAIMSKRGACINST